MVRLHALRIGASHCLRCGGDGSLAGRSRRWCWAAHRRLRRPRRRLHPPIPADIVPWPDLVWTTAEGVASADPGDGEQAVAVTVGPQGFVAVGYRDEGDYTGRAGMVLGRREGLGAGRRRGHVRCGRDARRDSGSRRLRRPRDEHRRCRRSAPRGVLPIDRRPHLAAGARRAPCGGHIPVVADGRAARRRGDGHRRRRQDRGLALSGRTDLRSRLAQGPDARRADRPTRVAGGLRRARVRGRPARFPAVG